MKQTEYINSLNLNAHTDFPYLILHVEDDTAYPLNPGFRVMHWHEDLQFIYVISGTIRVTTLEEKILLLGGEGIFINKNVVHLVERVGSCKYRSFLFPESFVSFAPWDSVARLTQGITQNTGISLVELRPGTAWTKAALTTLKELMEMENENGDALYRYRVLSKLSVLWLSILQNVKGTEPMPVSRTSERMKKFLAYMEAHYAEEITLEAMAASANVSTSECLRCFKATLQTTPYQYLLDNRLLKAARLLRETDLPISQVASMTGFNQQSYFGKRFKEKMKCTPSAYRGKSK
jgi:AraC-like DNA-binding protein